MGDVVPGETLRRTAFWYLRHGETDWNAQGLSQGNVDIPRRNACAIAASRASSVRRCRAPAIPRQSPARRWDCRYRSMTACAKCASACRKASR